MNKDKTISNYYIAHSSIIDIIKPYLSINEGITFKPIKLFTKDNNKIFYYYNSNIIIGKINENHIFTSNTIISYKSSLILDEEKKVFLKHSIDEYISLRNCKKNNLNKLILINENNEEIGELIILLHKNKNNKNKNILIDISNTNKNSKNKKQNGVNINKNRANSSQPSKKIRNNKFNFNKNEEKNIRIKNISYRKKENRTNSISSYNNSESNFKKTKLSIDSKDKKFSTNNSFFENPAQNNIHTNIIVRDFSNKSKEKIDKNFKGLINYTKQRNLNAVNDLKQKEKELKKQLEIINNLKLQNNLLLEKNKKLEKNEENLKQNILNIQNELNQKQQESENEIKLNKIYTSKREEIININSNYINQINYLDKEIKEKDNEINELKQI